MFYSCLVLHNLINVFNHPPQGLQCNSIFGQQFPLFVSSPVIVLHSAKCLKSYNFCLLFLSKQRSNSLQKVICLTPSRPPPTLSGHCLNEEFCEPVHVKPTSKPPSADVTRGFSTATLGRTDTRRGRRQVGGIAFKRHRTTIMIECGVGGSLQTADHCRSLTSSHC